MTTITKRDLIVNTIRKFGYTQTFSRGIVQSFLDSVVDELSNGNKVEIRNFGVFTVKTRKAKVASNPITGEAMNVPAKDVVVFKPGKELKDRVNQVN